MHPELEASALKAWPGVIEAIDALVRRAEVGDWGDVRPNTSMATDDARTLPFPTSHAVKLLLNAASDNLHGVRHLIWGPKGQMANSPVIHQSAHYVLARGALENAATALWVLAPASRAERVTRTFRWYAQNVKDQAQALGELPGTPAPHLEERLSRLANLWADATGNEPARFRAGYTTTETMRYVTELETEASIPAIFTWRLCSGFAHGRPWATLNFQEIEEEPTNDPDVFSARVSSDLTRALLAPKHALHLLERLLKVYAARNTPA